MKISLTNYQQYLICAAILYAKEAGFLSTSNNKDYNMKEFQNIIDKMSIDTPIKTGGVNQFNS